jgi:predicted neutral ceramidase superfamily lipid hydrolase
MYSRLFKLPRLPWIVSFGILFNILLSFLVTHGFSNLTGENLFQAEFFVNLAICFGIISGAFVISSILSNRVLMGRLSGVMNSRRTLGVSLFSLIFADAVFLVGWVLYAVLLIPLLVEFFVLALAAIFTVRLLVSLVMVGDRLFLSVGDSLSQPLLVSVVLLEFFGLQWFVGFLLRFLVVAGIFFFFTFVYVRTIGSQLKKVTDVDGRIFFRAFLSEWSAGIGDELEGIIERNSTREDLKIASLSFRNKRGKIKAVVVVPSIHPGPFKGIGSSDLPGYLMRKLEKEFGCPVVCLHGPSTHGQDLVRSSQCEDVYVETLETLKGVNFTSDCSSPLAEVSEGGISVSCQVLGDFAILTGSSSSSLPIDDVSLSVGNIAVAATRKFVKEAIFVDSHNCINPDSDYVWPGSRAGKLLVKASQEAAEKASKLQKCPFKVGAAKLRATGISKIDGMGEEGISAIVFQIANSRIVYAFFDSNNLMVNVRAILAKKLVEMGFDSVQVLTSDTHSTSALSPGRMGYNPLGYSTPHERLLQLVASVSKRALSNLEDARVSIGVRVLKEVKVAGEKNIQNILRGVRNSLTVAKKLAPVSFGSATILSMIPLILL